MQTKSIYSPYYSWLYLKSTANLYVMKNYGIWLLIVTSIITSVVALFEGIEKMRTTFGRADVSLGFIVEMTLLRVPQHLIDFMPFIFFLACLLALWKLNQTQEMISMRACGVSGAQISLGCFTASFLMALLSLFILNPIAASCNARHQHLQQRILKHNDQSLAISATGFWARTREETGKTIFHAQSFTLKESTFHTVTFYEYDNNDMLLKRIQAENAVLKLGKWDLKQVKVWTSEGLQPQNIAVLEKPTHITLKQLQQSSTAPTHVPFWQIPHMIDVLKQSGMSVLMYELFWHKMWAELMLLGFMSVLAVGFCLKNPRKQATSRLIGLAIATGFAIHFLNKIINAFGEAERLSPLWSAWLPTLITALVGIGYLMHCEEHE